MFNVLAIIAAYLIGSLSFAVIVSKYYGMDDPRTYGSGNPGATNVLRSGKKKAAALTLAACPGGSRSAGGGARGAPKHGGGSGAAIPRLGPGGLGGFHWAGAPLGAAARYPSGEGGPAAHLESHPVC